MSGLKLLRRNCLMQNEAISLPKIDTQNIWLDYRHMDSTNRKEFIKQMKSDNKPNSGVYVVFHNRWSKERCLYVGASIRLNQRVSRFFTPQGNIENQYLYYMLKGMEQEKDLDRIKIRFYFTSDINSLGFYEKFFTEKYKPMLVLNFNYHKLQQRTIDTHKHLV